MIRENRPIDIAFRITNGIIMTLLTMIMLFPFMHVIAKAFSGESPILAGKVILFPKEFQWKSIKLVINSSQYMKSLANSGYLVLIGASFSLLVTVMTAYPLSKVWLPHRRGFLLFFVFTMLFSGGMVPAYLLRSNLGLLNSFWALILPGLSVYNMLIMKSYFEGIPEALEESASLDGANNWIILFKIYLPLSLPAFATIGLFYAVGFWNDYFGPTMYIAKNNLQVLQVYLRNIVYITNLNDLEKALMSSDELMNVASESVVSATVVASTLPILIVYPFIQKYFVKGMVIGSVKG